MILIPAKFQRLALIFTALLTLHAQVHAFFWSDWHEAVPGAGKKDLPFVQGQPTKEKYRSSSCAFCPTGAKGQGALFSTDGTERHYGETEALEREVIEKSERLLQQAIPKSEWIYIRKAYDDSNRYFYPIRIFVPSIDPLILITTPWTYKDALTKNFNGDGLSLETNAFYEWETTAIGNEHRYKRVLMRFGNELFLPFEIRGTLPKEISHIQVISKGFQQSVSLPIQPDDEKVTLKINRQTLIFSRSDNGKVFISFENK